jgi:hypothetical protein
MLSTFRANRRRGRALIVLAFLATIVVACGGSTAAPAGAPAAGPGTYDGGYDALGGESGDTNGDAVGAQGDDSPRDLVYAAGRPDLLIIKTGEMVLQVTGIDAALSAATDVVTELGGYASGSDRSGDGESDRASITFRVPAANWDQAIERLRAIGTKVLAERSGTQDVTSQVVDLGARIRNLQATEQALQAIMARATEIKDVLAVQDQLTSVRGQIEQLTAQKSTLEQQAAMSTLTVTFSLKPDPVLATQTGFDPKTQVDEASASLVRILQAVASAGIWFAIVWLPILLVLLVVVGIVLFVVRRLNRRAASSDATPTPTTPTTPDASTGEAGA